jgi:hypothetical protein
MVEMKKTEFEQWQKSRAKGKWNYVFKTSLVSLLIAFCVYFFGNAYVHRDELELYFDSFVIDIAKNLLVLAMAFSALIIFSLIFWGINEKRYKKAENNFNNKDNETKDN